MRYLVLDIETIGIPNAADFLPVGDIEPDGRLKDPEKIKSDIASKHQAMVNGAALDLDLARLVAVGTCHDTTANSTVLKTEDDERGYLEALGHELDPYGRDFVTLITFNGHRYDLPLLMRRARYLGVNFSRINLDRYKSPHIDLYEELTMRGTIKAHGLRWYFKRHGWTDLIDADPLANGGADVARAWAEGHYEDVGAHVRCDVAGTIRLAQWMGVIPKAPAVL